MLVGLRAIGLERRGMEGSTMDAALTGFRRAGRELSHAKDTLKLLENLNLDPETSANVRSLRRTLANTRGELEVALSDMKTKAASSRERPEGG